jgi:hypothetical protein
MDYDEGERLIMDEARQTVLDNEKARIEARGSITDCLIRTVKTMGRRALGIRHPDDPISAKTMDTAFSENEVVSENMERVACYEDLIKVNNSALGYHRELMETINDEFREKIEASQTIIDNIKNPKEPVDIMDHIDYKLGGFFKIK